MEIDLSRTRAKEKKNQIQPRWAEWKYLLAQIFIWLIGQWVKCTDITCNIGINWFLHFCLKHERALANQSQHHNYYLCRSQFFHLVCALDLLNGKFNIIFSPSWLLLLPPFFVPFHFGTEQRRTFDAEIRISFKNLPIDLKEILRLTNFQIIQIPIEHCISYRLHLLFFFPFFFAYFIMFATLPIQFYSILALFLSAAWIFFFAFDWDFQRL